MLLKDFRENNEIGAFIDLLTIHEIFFFKIFFFYNVSKVTSTVVTIYLLKLCNLQVSIFVGKRHIKGMQNQNSVMNVILKY